mgnify:CR=1 FL=1
MVLESALGPIDRVLGFLFGVARGVLLIAGDDHAAKSSTMPHQSEQAFIAANVPVLHPAGVQEYLDYGLYGFAMSRYSGTWTALPSPPWLMLF